MRKLLFIILLCLITTSVSGQFFAPNQKPMLGFQINKAHSLGDPVAFYLGNEGSGGQVFDLSGNNQNITFSGTPTWGGGKYGSALILNNDSYGTLVDSPLLRPAKFTIVAGVNWSTFTRSTIISNCDAADGGDEGFFFPANDATLDFYIYDGSWEVASLANPLSTGVDYQVAATYDGLTQSIYVDGVWKAGNVADGPILYGSPLFPKIGWYSGDSISARIDYIYFYNRALSPSEITYIYQFPFCMLQRSWNWMLYGGISVTPSGQVIFIN